MRTRRYRRVEAGEGGLWSRLARGGWAVGDQALFAGANFILNLLLARWLAPSEYGAYTGVLVLFLLAGVAHGALLTEPMLVLGPARHKNTLPQYLGSLCYGHLFLVLPTAIVFIVAAFFLRPLAGGPSAVLLAVYGAALPFFLGYVLLRRASYLYGRPRLAATASGIYFTVVLVVVWVLEAGGWLSAPAAVGATGLGGVAGGAFLLWRLPVAYPGARAALRPASVRPRHWRYGRWAMATGAVSWLSGCGFYLLLPVWGGWEAGAALKALVNFVLPAGHVVTAFVNLLTPGYVGASLWRRRRLLGVSALLLMAVALVYWLLLGIWGESLIHAVYNGRYDGYGSVLWAVGLIPLAGGLVVIFDTALRTENRYSKVFQAHAVAGLAVVAAAWPAVAWQGVAGAAIVLVGGLALTAALLAWQLLRPTATSRRLASVSPRGYAR